VAADQPLESHLKRSLYDALLGDRLFPRNPTRREKGLQMTPFERALGVVYNLRMKRCYDRGNQLETALDSFMDDDSLTEKDAVLRFLLCLVETGSSYDNTTHKFTYAGVQTRLNGDSTIIPEGILFYSDTILSRSSTSGSTGPYMMYREELFNGLKQECDNGTAQDLSNVMSSAPGSGLSCFSNCSIQEPSTLFDGLTHSTVTSLHVNLDLPPLSETQRMSLLPHLHQSHSTPTTTDKTATKDIPTDSITYHLLNVWDLALREMSEPSPMSQSWDKEKKQSYLTEAGCEAFDRAYKLRQRCLVNMASVVVEPVCTVSEKDLVKAALFVVVGVPSRFFNLQRQEFNVQTNVMVSGRSPISLQRLLAHFATIGTHYLRLHALASFYSRIGDESGGLVRQAFGHALSEYLDEYRHHVINWTEDDATLFSLSVQFQSIACQLGFLHDVCMCGPDHHPVNSDFPSGIGLLSYLFEITRDNISSPHYLILLSFLQSSCQPYFLFLHEWLFEGILFDPYGEFMIQMNEQYLEFRDKRYWSLGYIAADKECVPVFLSDLRKAVLVCGKSVNLLKLCSRGNALCNTNITRPKFAIHMSLNRLQQVKATCELYVRRVKDKLKDASYQRLLQHKLQEEAKHQESVNHRKRMSEAMAIEDALKVQQQAKDEAKKRALFDSLKLQMEEDIQRRGLIEEGQRESDLHWMRELSLREAAASEAEVELEKRVRQELIEHYESLARDVANREARAHWKIARASLNEVRRQFLAEDFNHWKATTDDASPDTNPTQSESAEINPEDEVSTETASIDVTITDTEQTGNGHGGYKPVGIIPGVFAKEKAPVSLEEALHAIGFDATSEGVDFVQPDQNTDTVRYPEADSSVPSDGGGKDVYQSETINSPDVSHLNDMMELPLNTDNQELSITHHPMSLDGLESINSTLGMREAQSSRRDGEPPSKVQDILYVHYSEKLLQPSSTGHAPPSVDQSGVSPGSLISNMEDQDPPFIGEETIYGTDKNDMNKADGQITLMKGNEAANVFDESQNGMESDYKINDTPTPSTMSTREEEEMRDRVLSQHKVSLEEDYDYAHDQAVSTRGHEPPSVIQEIMYKQDSQPEVFQTTRGHAPESTIQMLMYPDVKSKKSMQRESVSPEKVEFDPLMDPVISSLQKETEPFAEDLNCLDYCPNSDLMAKIQMEGSSLDKDGKGHVDALNPLSLLELINRSIVTPLTSQVSVVNQAVIAYFMEELGMQEHFSALRHFLLLEDGEFGHALTDGLCTKLSSGISPSNLCSAGTLNGLLGGSLEASLNVSLEQTSRLSFSLKRIPRVLKPNDINALDFLELRYKAPWPVNIVITEMAISRYGKLFNFMLQLKRATWALKDIGQRLKRSGRQMKERKSEQLHRLHLFRREMQHFVTVMDGYVVNQIIHVSWLEFQQQLKEVDGLDDLCDCHASYLNRMLFRSLLTKKAVPVMKMVQDILSLVLQFRTQIMSNHWRLRGTHPSFDNVCSTYDKFKQYSGFLFIVIAKLVDRGYQPHLEALLLQLDFNSHYSHRVIQQ
jgi:gamma-tubulin complex component 6